MSIRKQYDTDLEALKAALVEMGSNSAEPWRPLWKHCAPPMPKPPRRS